MTQGKFGVERMGWRDTHYIGLACEPDDYIRLAVGVGEDLDELLTF